MVGIFGSHNFWSLGIELLSADDFATWYLSVEVLGNTVYEVSGPHPRHPVLPAAHPPTRFSCANAGREVCAQVPVRYPLPNLRARRPVRRRRHLRGPGAPRTSRVYPPTIPVICSHTRVPPIACMPAACLFEWSCTSYAQLLGLPQPPKTDAHVPQICASILGSEWSPVLSVVSVCVTIQSMLASCKVRCAASSSPDNESPSY